MKKIVAQRFIQILALACLGAAQPTFAGLVTLQAGVRDNFALPIDTAGPDGSYGAAQCGTNALKGFDDPTSDKWVCVTFDLTPFQGHIKGATVDFSACALRGNPQNDDVGVFSGSASTTSRIGSTATAPGLLTTTWDTGTCHEFLGLDFFNASFLNEMNLPGATLQFLAEDDTNIDYVRVTLRVPEPPALILLIAGLGGWAISARRRRSDSAPVARNPEVASTTLD